jgi:hypothetical protein
MQLSQSTVQAEIGAIVGTIRDLGDGNFNHGVFNSGRISAPGEEIGGIYVNAEVGVGCQRSPKRENSGVSIDVKQFLPLELRHLASNPGVDH